MDATKLAELRRLHFESKSLDGSEPEDFRVKQSAKNAIFFRAAMVSVPELLDEIELLQAQKAVLTEGAGAMIRELEQSRRNQGITHNDLQREIREAVREQKEYRSWADY